MTDSPLSTFGADLDYLYLPDDDPRDVDSLAATGEIAAVSDLGSTGEFALADEQTIVRVPATVRTDGAETEVYGLNLSKPENERRPLFNLPIPGPAIAALVGGLALILALALIIPRLFAPKKTKTAPAQPVQEEVEPEPALLPGELMLRLASLSYQDSDLALTAEDATINVKDGQVLVVHQLASLDDIDVAALLRDSARRATAFASSLTDERVAQGSDDEGAVFSKLTWQLRVKDGDTLLALVELPGELRQADSDNALFAGAAGYVLSQDVLDALGEDSGLALSAGEAPTDLDGNAIQATATLPHKEEPEAKPEEESSEEHTEEYTEYYTEPTYEETYYTEQTYTEPVYEEPTYTEPVYEEPTDTGGNEDWGGGYVEDGGESYSDAG